MAGGAAPAPTPSVSGEVVFPIDPLGLGQLLRDKGRGGLRIRLAANPDRRGRLCRRPFPL